MDSDPKVISLKGVDQNSYLYQSEAKGQVLGLGVDTIRGRIARTLIRSLQWVEGETLELANQECRTEEDHGSLSCSTKLRDVWKRTLLLETAREHRSQ